MSDIDDIFQGQYPKPIAAMYGQAVTMLDGPLQADWLLRVLETAIKYLALTGLVRLRSADEMGFRTLVEKHIAALAGWTTGQGFEVLRAVDGALEKSGDSLAGTPLTKKRDDVVRFNAIIELVDGIRGRRKWRLIDAIERSVTLRNDVHHRPCPPALEQRPDLLKAAVQELLSALPALRGDLLVQARSVTPRRHEYEVRLVCYRGDGSPRPLDSIRSLDHPLIKDSLYLFDAARIRFLEVSPLLQAEGGDILMYDRMSRGRARFSCPYAAGIGLRNGDQTQQEMRECLPELFRVEQWESGSRSTAPVGVTLRDDGWEAAATGYGAGCIDHGGGLQTAHDPIDKPYAAAARTPNRTYTEIAIPAPPPRQRRSLVGRGQLLADLGERLRAGESVALFGPPGVGKSAIAANLFRDAALVAHFDHNVAWIQLGANANVLALLGKLGESVGLPAEILVGLQSVEARMAAINETIAGRAFLFVVDDAEGIDDALAFRLGGEQSSQLLTTRQLAVAVDFSNPAHETVVPELAISDGLELLERFVPEVVRESREAAERLVRLAGGLPFALTVIGGYLRSKTRARPASCRKAELDRLISDARARLDVTFRDDRLTPEVSIAAIAQASVDGVDSESASCLAGLCLFPAAPNTFSEAAALTVSRAPAEQLYKLVDFGLLSYSEPDRYSLNPLVVDYLRLQHGPAERDEAGQRFVEYFASLVETTEGRGGHIPEEHGNVLESFRLAEQLGLWGVLVNGINAFWPELESQGLYAAAEDVLRRARDAGGAAGLPPEMKARTLLNLGSCLCSRSQHAQSIAALKEGLELVGEEDPHSIRTDLLHELGRTLRWSDHYAEARECLERSLALARAAGDQWRIVNRLVGLGELDEVEGKIQKSERHLREALELARSGGYEEEHRRVLLSLGWVLAHRGALPDAKALWSEALEMARVACHQPDLVAALTASGWVHDRLGDRAEGLKLLEEGIHAARRVGHLPWLLWLLLNRATALMHGGAYIQARTTLQEALEVAGKLGGEDSRAIVLEGLGFVANRLGRATEAHVWLRSALMSASTEGLERKGAIQTFLAENALDRDLVEEAEALATSAVAIAGQLNNPERRAFALRALSRVAEAKGDPGAAAGRLTEAIRLSRAIRYRWLTGMLLNDLGQLQASLGQAVCQDAFAEARAIGDEIGSIELVGLARLGEARAARIEGDHMRAHELATLAREELNEAGLSERRDVRKWFGNV